jgi:hypothetical protein
MTSAETGPDGPEDRHTGCADCDPGLLDHLKCRAKGIQAQADYNKAHETELDEARKQYDSARGGYNAARKAGRPDEDDLRKQLDQMVDQLTCLVDEPSKIRLLNRAFHHVQHRLRECYPSRGCQFDDDCDFDQAVDGCGPDDVAATIADIERRTAAAKATFVDLIAEPVNAPKRLADLKTEVADISTQMASDSRRVNFKELYAAALVARDHLETLWRGFANVNAYVDCLCRALTCQIKGYAAISQLKGKAAVHQCHRDQDAAACVKLRDHTTDEVMAEYIRLKHEAHEDPDRPQDNREDDRPDERPGERGPVRERDRERERDRDDDEDWRGRPDYRRS